MRDKLVDRCVYPFRIFCVILRCYNFPCSISFVCSIKKHYSVYYSTQVTEFVIIQIIFKSIIIPRGKKMISVCFVSALEDLLLRRSKITFEILSYYCLVSFKLVKHIFVRRWLSWTIYARIVFFIFPETS